MKTDTRNARYSDFSALHVHIYILKYNFFPYLYLTYCVWRAHSAYIAKVNLTREAIKTQVSTEVATFAYAYRADMRSSKLSTISICESLQPFAI